MSLRAIFTSVLALVGVLAILAFSRPEPLACAAEGGDFLSQKGCKKCHFKQARSWKKTVHAKAMDTLKPGAAAEAKTKAGLDPQMDYTKDPACIKCHVTGYGQTGGYPELKDAWSDEEQTLAKNNGGVGCEACHGAGSKYSPYKKEHEDYKTADVVALGLMTPVTAGNCTGCHNTESPTAGEGYVFDFETMKANAEAIHAHVPLKHEHK